MKKVYEVLSDAVSAMPLLSVRLPFDERKKSRLKVVTETGEPLGLVLPRGQILRGGTLLRDETGRVIQIEAADESVSTVLSDNPLNLLRAAYHLGNRHVALQVGEGWLRYQQDHVLDAMVAGLGLQVRVESQPFEPEAGAYAAGHHHEH